MRSPSISRWAVLLLPLLLTDAAPAASPAYGLLRRADQALNAGDLAHADGLYAQAAGLATRDDELRCEIENDRAAVAMSKPDIVQFQRHFAAARDCLARLPSAAPTPDNLLVNGGFEAGLRPPWGTGRYENSQGRSAFGLWWNSMNARASMKIDRAELHSGRQSLRITNDSPGAPHVFTTTSQRIAGLKPNTLYRISLWAKARNLARGAAVFDVDAAWSKRLLALPDGSWEWRAFSESVNIGHNDYIDLRLIHQNTGTLWLDDIQVVAEAAPRDDPAALVQQAESLKDRARFDEALALYNELEQRFPDNRGLLRQVRHARGLIALFLGRYDEAQRDFQWLDGEGFRDAPIDLGELYHALGEWERADAEYRRARAPLLLDPLHPGR